MSNNDLWEQQCRADEARIAAAKAQQDAYRNSPEWAAIKAERIAAGLCVIEPRRTPGTGWCITHDVMESFGHYLETRPAEDRGHDPVSGIAYND